MYIPDANEYGYQFNGTWMCQDCLDSHKVEIEEW